MSTWTADAPPGATAEDRKFLDRHGTKLSKTALRAKPVFPDQERRADGSDSNAFRLDNPTREES